MSDATPAAAKPKKKGGMKKILVMAVAVLGLLGGGIGAGIYAAGSGMVGGAHAAEAKEDPNKPKLVERHEGEGGEHPPTPSGHGGGGGEEAIDTSRYQATYYPMEQSFTANLSDTNGFVQLGIGVSTYYDEKVLDNLKKNDMPVRSAVLMTLSEQSAEALSTPEGKTNLQRQLKDAINQTLRQKEGFGGIDSVYFTSFIIQ